MAVNETPFASDVPTADHSASLARVLAYAATGGVDGVIGPGDCKVLPLSTPGASVRIVPGAWTGLNRATGARSQAFVAEVPTETVVPIAATGSGGGRRDLIALVIGSDGKHKPVVVPNVGASVTRLQQVPGYEYTTGLALAAVTLPASTATVTAGMVRDLRSLAQPKTKRDPVVGQPWANQGPTATWAKWPSFEAQIEVPVWATHVTVLATVAGIKVNTALAQGSMRVLLGTLPGVYRQYDLAGVQGQIVDLDAFAVLDARSMAGTVQTVKLETIAGAAGNLITGAATQQVFDIQFDQRIV